MTGIGRTLRDRRVARGESLTTCSGRTGLDIEVLAALEDERIDAVGSVEDAAGAVRRYAVHLELDAHRLADEVRAQFTEGSDADTQPIPIVRALRKAKEPAALWIGGGVLLGFGLLAVLSWGGGRDSERPQAGSPAAPAPPESAQPPGTTTRETLRPSEPVAPPAIDLRLGGRAGKTVWVEVRRGGVSGDQIFAGIVGGGITRRFRSERPLWLGVAWAPNLDLTLNGEPLDATGGTESYVVTRRGLRRLGSG